MIAALGRLLIIVQECDEESEGSRGMPKGCKMTMTEFISGVRSGKSN